MVEISHACVFNTETEEFEVIKIDDFATFKPSETYKDFHQYTSYTVKCGPRKFDDVEILALGGIGKCFDITTSFSTYSVYSV